MDKYIKVRTKVNGIHYWPDALPDVFYLSHPHRHTFIIDMTFQVKSGDREREFILTKEKIHELLQVTFCLVRPFEYNFHTYSCEHIAEKLYDALPTCDQRDCVEISVSEDDEFFGIISKLRP